MADSDATRPAPLARRAARRGGARKAARPAEDLPGRGARASARPTRCCSRRGAKRGRRRRRRSAWSRPTAAPRPRRCCAGSRSCRAAGSTTAAACSRRWTSTRILARRPQLVLVDELAHTNAPGSRHPKRYLDVEELLAAGIDVYTTLNIQHVESLNDVVAQITRVRVRETVPDSHHRPRRRDRADRPDARRPDPAPEGGQGLRPRAGRARARALFLARQPDGAARAGAARAPPSASTTRCSSYMRAHAIAGPWAAGERVLVCISEQPRAAGARPLRQAAGRPAARALDGALRRDRRARRAARGRARPHRRDAAAGRAAGRRGRRPCPARGIAEEILAYARAQQRHPDRHRQVRRARAGSSCCTARSSHDLMRRAGDISVHVIAGDEAGEPSPSAVRDRRARAPAALDPLPYVVALLAVAVALGVGWLIDRCSASTNIALVFLTAVLSARRALRAGAVALRLRRQRRSPTTSSSCRRSTPSRSPTRERRGALSSSSSWPSSPATSRRACAPGGRRAAGARAHDRGALCLQPQARRRRRRSTTCCGPPPTRSPRC